MNGAAWMWLSGILSGYMLGRLRPVHAIDAWNTKRVIWERANWADVALFAVFHPVQAWRAWQHRNDPPPTYVVPTIDPRWLADRTPTDPQESAR